MKKILLLICMLLPTITYAKITDENIKDLKYESSTSETASMNEIYLEEEDYIIFLAEQGIYRYDKHTYEFKKVSFGNWDTTIVPFYGNYLTISRVYNYETKVNYNVLTVLDSDLNVVEQKELDLPGDNYYYGDLYKDGDTIYLSSSNSSNYYIVDKDLNITLAETTPSEAEITRVTREFSELIAKEDSSLAVYNVEKNNFGTFYVIVVKENTEEKILNVEVREYDKDKNLISKKNIYNDAYVPSQYFSPDISYKKEKLEDYYIEAYAVDDVSIINIYDKENNLVKSLNPLPEQDENPNGRALSLSQSIGKIIAILPTNNGFYLVSSSWTTNYPLTSTIDETKNIPDAKGIVGTTIFAKYSFDYVINTITDGNGSIKCEKVIAGNGEEVQFTIEPKEGYVLSVVKVIDNEGNVVEFNDYTFTMPNRNVVIEAQFTKTPTEEKNPETADIAIIICIAIILSGVTLTYLNVRKMSELV